MVVQRNKRLHISNCGKKNKILQKYYICENNTGEVSSCDFIAWNGPDKNGVIHPADLSKEVKTTKPKQKRKRVSTKKEK